MPSVFAHFVLPNSHRLVAPYQFARLSNRLIAAFRLAFTLTPALNVTFRRHTFLKTLGSTPSPIVKFGRFCGGASSACHLTRYQPVRCNVSNALRAAAKLAAARRVRHRPWLYQADKRQN